MSFGNTVISQGKPLRAPVVAGGLSRLSRAVSTTAKPVKEKSKTQSGPEYWRRNVREFYVSAHEEKALRSLLAELRRGLQLSEKATRILETVALEFSMPVAHLMGDGGRQPDKVIARGIAMFLLEAMHGYRASRIAEMLRMERTTSIKALRRIKSHIEADADVWMRVEAIRKRLEVAA